MSHGKHGPNRFANYWTVHETVMQQFIREGFVILDGLVLETLDNSILIYGTIVCLGRIYIDVKKELSILSGEGADAMVQTVDYSYNAVLTNVGNILRYDSPHLDHNQEHHVHRYDVLNGDKKGRVEFIYDEEQRPTLGEVIREVEEWFYKHYEELSGL